MAVSRDERLPGRRRSLRLPGYDYSQPGAYFITIVTHGRQLLFLDPSTRGVVETLWSALPARFDRIALETFVVMPNHVHGILIITDDPVGAGSPRPFAAKPHPAQGKETLPRIGMDVPVGAIHESPLQVQAPGNRRSLLSRCIGYFKMNTAKRINQMRGTPGVPVWQRNYYEHVVRSDAELSRVRQYIADNPARWDLDPENPARVASSSIAS